jgi:hypothetical protein
MSKATIFKPSTFKQNMSPPSTKPNMPEVEYV